MRSALIVVGDISTLISGPVEGSCTTDQLKSPDSDLNICLFQSVFLYSVVFVCCITLLPHKIHDISQACIFSFSVMTLLDTFFVALTCPSVNLF